MERQSLEDFLRELKISLVPDSESGPVSEALERAERLKSGEEHLPSLELRWIRYLKTESVKHLPETKDLVAILHLVEEVAHLQLPLNQLVWRGISIGMAYQAEIDKHASNQHGETPT